MDRPTIMTEDYFREFFGIVFAQRRLILAVALLVFLTGVAIALFYPPTYAAHAAVLVRGKEAEKELQTLERVEVRRFPIVEQDLYSEVETLKSPDVVRRALQRLDPGGPGASESALLEQITRILAQLETKVIPASNVIRVSLFGRSPSRTVRMLEVLLQQYVQYRTELRNPNTAVAFLSQQAARYEANLKGAEERLLALAEGSGTAEPAMEMETNLLLKRDLSKELSVLEQEAIDKRGLIKILDAALSQTHLQYFSAVDNKAINRLAEKLIDLTVERGQLARTYSSESTAMQQINRQIGLMYQELKAEIVSYTTEQRMEFDIINQKIAGILDQIASIDARNMDLNRQQVERDAIRREAKLQETSFETFAKRREGARIDTTLDSATLSSFVSVLTHAYPSDGPVFPRPRIVIPLGLVVGLILGLTVGFLNEFFDNTFRRPEDVERYAGLPVLFSIPDIDAPSARRGDHLLQIMLLAAVVISLAAALWKPKDEAPSDERGPVAQGPGIPSLGLRETPAQARANSGTFGPPAAGPPVPDLGASEGSAKPASTQEMATEAGSETTDASVERPSRAAPPLATHETSVPAAVGGQVLEDSAHTAPSPATEHDRGALSPTEDEDGDSGRVPAEPPRAETAPSAGIAAPDTIRGKSWLMQQNGSEYTIQLAASASRAKLLEFVARHGVNSGELAIFTRSDGKKGAFVLVYGTFQGLGTAQQGLASLPASVREQGPWIREISAVQAETRAEAPAKVLRPGSR